MNISRLIFVKNYLKNNQFQKESDDIDILLKKISQQKIEDKDTIINSYDYLIKDKMPWNVWNSISQNDRADLYKRLDSFGWLPFLKSGAISVKFILKCFERNWDEASSILFDIIINIFLKKQTIYIVKMLISNNIIKEKSIKDILKNSESKQILIKYLSEYALKYLDNISLSFKSSSMYNELPTYLSKYRQLIEKYISDNINKIID